jgi:uncharacterized protein
MMKEIIVDTSALVEFFVSSERHHLAAQKYFLENSHTRWIILNTVFDETVTWFRAKISINNDYSQLSSLIFRRFLKINIPS